ncbi:DUF3810 domain-containing protein [Ferruginibacter sp. HRS2-29]|uniref:DUF3810 domain-containing protein n=1 Tax=Ferruginibacter sp. HRS2-29 TaxID=2487334 RepID=UPI0020CC9738|nr:DUF3810 domain-containing protein [Ferruginibacter sp. HRS2-29]MCP9749412.1 DUF3810 domain-containing protein [Ferruginibacter sp. HRS2-29]
MKFTRRASIAIILVILCIIVHFYSGHAARVEQGYSTHLYKYISISLRLLFGWIPFSVGDILYGALFIWLIFKVVRFSKKVFRRRTMASFKEQSGRKLLRAITLLSILYLVFNVLWGINYNRKGIASQLGLKMEKYSQDDLKMLNGLLVAKINSSKAVLIRQQRNYPNNDSLIAEVKNAYDQLAQQYPYLVYEHVSLKPSIWGWLGNYAGFSGYYNPFTGEAQLNTTMPRFLLPYTACHEVAHQIGYAKEMEANFVGYLAASTSTDTSFHYSVYLDLFNYANRNLYFTDSAAAGMYRKQLSPAVVADIKEWIAFSRKYRNPIEPFIRWGYGVFLRSNQQPQGILSYDEVTGFLIAYYKKFGRI